jgi:phosphonopyruvate decarboxylase
MTTTGALTAPSTRDALSYLLAARQPEDVVVATMTAAVILPTISTSDRDLCYIAPMGSASSVGLGVALARPDLRVFVIDGDGSVLMNLGSLVTIGGRRPANLVHVVLNNGGYHITGHQPLPMRDPEVILRVAEAAGYARVARLRDLQAPIASLLGDPGPIMLLVDVQPAYDRAEMPAWTHSEQALRSQGPAGFATVRAALAGDVR